jgi:hypothetical protein
VLFLYQWQVHTIGQRDEPVSHLSVAQMFGKVFTCKQYSVKPKVSSYSIDLHHSSAHVASGSGLTLHESFSAWSGLAGAFGQHAAVLQRLFLALTLL